MLFLYYQRWISPHIMFQVGTLCGTSWSKDDKGINLHLPKHRVTMMHSRTSPYWIIWYFCVITSRMSFTTNFHFHIYSSNLSNTNPCVSKWEGKNLFKVSKIKLKQRSLNVVVTLFCWLWTCFCLLGSD